MSEIGDFLQKTRQEQQISIRRLATLTEISHSEINKIENGKLYQILNLAAAILMAIGLYPTKAWFSFALQIVWALVAIISIIKLIKKK